jgi:uncharacterized protein YndB with AHSA1/START domain
VEPDRTGVRPTDEPTASHALSFGRRLDLPRGIVWDALVDPVLVSGWLGEAEIDPVPGGRFDVSPGAPEHRRPAALGRGVVVAMAAPRELEVESAEEAGAAPVRIRFVLDDVPGGPRDRSTAITVTVTSPTPFARPEEAGAAWLTHLDLLHDLLHGRIADWDRWAADREPAWLAHRADTARRDG